MTRYIDKSAVVAEIERLHKEWRWYSSTEAKYRCAAYRELSEFLNTLEVKEMYKQPLTKDLKTAAGNYAFTQNEEDEVLKYYAFIAGAEWQAEHLWKDAQGDDLPEIDREVVALIQDYPDDKEHLRIAYAHRPPEYWDGKNIITNEVTRYEPKRYDKGGWNQPNVKWWLDLDLPKMQE